MGSKRGGNRVVSAELEAPPLEVNALECHAEQHAEYHGAVVEVGSCAYVCEGLFPSYKMQRVAFLFATCKGLKKRGVQK
jgi:hypothetical protein